MSGFAGGNYYGGAGGGGGAGTGGNNPGGFRYRSQLGGGIHVVNPAVAAPKRSLAEIQLQQQQQAMLMRSVKQRTQQTSPISTLSPLSPELSTASSAASAGRSYGFQYGSQLISSPAMSFPSSAGIRCGTEPEPDSAKKMKNCLQELERQLLDDDEDGGGGGAIGTGSSVSAITSSDLSETMQSLIGPQPPPQQQKSLSVSPSSSSSSSPSTITNSPPLRQQLLEAASAISEGQIEPARAILMRLNQSLTTLDGTREQRLAAYLAAALLTRITNSPDPNPAAKLYSSEHLMATQMLYDASPCFKLGFMAAGLAILEATQSHSKIHILDFDIGRGGQYIVLLHALAERQAAKPTVKITAVCDPGVGSSSSDAGLRLVGKGLKKVADRFGVGFRFGVVSGPAATGLTREAIGCEPDEALAVSFAYRLYRVPDESVSTANPRDELLRLARGLGPAVVVVAEQELSANTAPFLARFRAALDYYGAALESLDTVMGREAQERARVEECLGLKAANAVAREGVDRAERCEVFGKWCARMGMAGLKPRPISDRITEAVRAQLMSSTQSNPDFTVKAAAGGLFFGWKAQPLAVVSAWH